MTNKNNVIRFIPSKKNSSWERSFPAKTISGCDWIVDVLDDLVAFCEANDLRDPATDLTQSRDRIKKTLQRLQPYRDPSENSW